MVSVTERDTGVLRNGGLEGDRALNELARALSDVGMRVQRCRTATDADVAELGSRWAKRLGIPRQRSAWILVARKSLRAER